MKTTDPVTPIRFIDLAAQQRRIRTDIDQAIAAVLDHGHYILGQEVEELEHNLAQYCGVKHAITCASGTDALLMALMACDVKPGEAIFLPAFTFVSTAEVVALLGATPFFIDVGEDDYLIDTQQLAEGIKHARDMGLKPRGIIPVDLFGLPADYDAINSLAKEEGLFVIADAAQSFGASAQGKKVGTLAEMTATSFFPAKPLGCYGDGGAVFTDDEDMAHRLKSIRVHGQGKDKYDNIRVGINGRMDTIQAAILLKKLAIFEDELTRREAIAQNYIRSLEEFLSVPVIGPPVTSAWAQFTLRVENRQRLASRLKERGVPTAIYYPKPIHQQSAYQHFPVAPVGLSVSEHLAGCVLSLPMHPYLEETTQAYIIDTVIECVKSVRES